MRKIISFPIKFYQYVISPFIKPSCRFYPSCSEYAVSAIKHHGVLRGIGFACWRLLRCHPWSLGGYDPVSPKKEENF